MSAATSSRSSAIWSRRHRLVRESMRATCKARPMSRPPRSACSTRSSARTREPARARVPQEAARGELDDKEIEIEVADTGARMPMIDIPGMPGQRGRR
jgi:ATP-dependent HslUV protease ATP-binding subunit HslU